MGTLPSSTKTPTAYSGVKNVEPCQIIKLRSGKEVEDSASKTKEASKELPEQDSYEARKESDEEPSSSGQQKKKEEVPTADMTSHPEKSQEVMTESNKTQKFVQERPPPPFPQRIRKAKEEQQFGKFMKILKQLHINIPLIEAIQQTPNYSKFMKDVLTKIKRVGEFATVALTQECSQLVQGKLPPKLKDPGRFTIPCTIGDTFYGKALCDLGASINLMPLSVFKKLRIGADWPTTITLQLEKMYW